MSSMRIPYCCTLLPAVSTTVVGQVNGSAIDMPTDLDCGCFILKAVRTAGSTLDVAIEASYDNGTTWFKRWGFTQVTTATISLSINVGFTKINQLGTMAASSAAAVANLAQNATTLVTGNVVTNAPMPRKIRVSYQPTGATPTYTLTVFFVGVRVVLAAAA